MVNWLGREPHTVGVRLSGFPVHFHFHFHNHIHNHEEKDMHIRGIARTPVYENDMIEIPDSAVQKFDDDAFAVVASATYTPRLQLMTSNSGPCQKGEFPTNNYALVQDQKYQDLGKEVELWAIAWRPKAIDMSDDDTILTSHDPKDPEFQRIQAKSDEKDSGCMYGPEYLVYVPAVNAFATFFMGSKSSRREAPALQARLKNSAILKSKLIETKKFSWYAPIVTPCSTPLDKPDPEKLASELEKFNNPPKDDKERVEESEERAR
jgi:hypothetical protein